MKKRSLLIALFMMAIVLLSACEQEKEPNPFVGKWSGSMDLTNQFVQNFIVQNPSLKEYVQFENLMITLECTFAEDSISFAMNETSGKQFVSNFETGVTNMVDTMVADVAADNNTTPENVYAAMNVTREDFIQSKIDSMDLEQMINALKKAYDLEGEYEYDEDSIIVYYEDDTFEEMHYSFQGDILSLTLSDGNSTQVVEFAK